MKIKDQALWEKCKRNNPDGYGAYVNTWAEQWADLMEAEMANGAKVEDIADRTSHEADTDGGTGFQYACVLATLRDVWEHGAELDAWAKSDIRNRI